MSNEYDFFQISPGSVASDWVTGSNQQQLRRFGTRMSNFGALNFGARMSVDYTRTTFDNAHEENPQKAVGAGFGTDRAEFEYNPYVWGSSVKRTLDDKMTKMGMGSIDQPRADVSDRQEVNASGMVSGKNYPSEGWRSFGGKYDFHKPYQG